MSTSRSIAAAALVLGLSGCADSSGPSSAETASETASASEASASETGSPPSQVALPDAILSIPLEDGPPLEPGTYRVSSEGRTGPDPLLWSIVDFTIDVPEGWHGHTGHYLSKNEDVEGAAGLVIYPVLVDEIYADPCEGERGRALALGPKVYALVKALLVQPGSAAAKPVRTEIGGLPATRVDLEVPKGADLRSCFLADYGPPGLQIWFSNPTSKYFVLMPGFKASIYVVDVDGERQVFLTEHDRRASEEDRRELQSMLDSIRID